MTTLEPARAGRFRAIGAGLRRHPLLWAVAMVACTIVLLVLVRTAVPATAVAYIVQRRDVVRTLVLTGRVRAPARASLGATVAGTVAEIRVQDGDSMRAGELLIRLDDREERAAVAEARAALAETEATVRSTVEQAELAQAQAVRDLRRARALFGQGAISRSDLERAQDAEAAARSRLDAARARVGNRADGTVTAHADGTGTATVQRARATLEAAEARLALTRITAPADGVVLARHVELGDVVQPGQPLLDVTLKGPTELVAYPAEENLGELHVGAQATASADAFPDRVFAARIAYIAPAVDPSQGTVEMRLAVPAPPAYLRPDMTVSVNADVQRRAHVLVVPLAAVRAPLSDTAWVALFRGGRVERRSVRLGVRGTRYVEVRSGLQQGDTVLDAGAPAGSGRGVRPRIVRPDSSESK